MPLEYPKTENLFTRDPETHKLTRELREPSFGQISGWLVTEKIDGTNIRLCLEARQVRTPHERVSDTYAYAHEATLRGRSDAATLPPNLLEEAAPQLASPAGLLEHMLLVLNAVSPRWAEDYQKRPTSLIVFGEGYGAGIQKGGKYAERKRLRIFDVVTVKGYASARAYPDVRWWRWQEVEAAASILGVQTVPVLRLGGHDRWPLDHVVAYVGDRCYSRVAAEERRTGFDVEAEGVVCRTDPYLYDFSGRRVLFKLKGKDLA